MYPLRRCGLLSCSVLRGRRAVEDYVVGPGSGSHLGRYSGMEGCGGGLVLTARRVGGIGGDVKSSWVKRVLAIGRRHGRKEHLPAGGCGAVSTENGLKQGGGNRLCLAAKTAVRMVARDRLLLRSCVSAVWGERPWAATKKGLFHREGPAVPRVTVYHDGQ